MRRLVLIAEAILFAAFLCGFSFPDPHRFVTDAANLLSPADKAALDAELAALEQETTWEFYVVTVPNMEGAAVERYAQDLFVHYGIGKKGANNGVLFFVAKDERKARIHTGYHAESVITDALATRIVREHVAPKTRAGDWSGGIADGTRAVVAKIREHHAQPAAEPAKAVPGAGHGLAIGAVVVGGAGAMAAMVLAFRRAKKRQEEDWDRINRDHEEWLARLRSSAPSHSVAAVPVPIPVPVRSETPTQPEPVSRRRSSFESSSSSSSSSSSYDYGGSSSSSSDSGGGWGGGGDSGGGGGGGDI
jgi:uncharacterized protein